jgi:hypothetical protein
MTGFLPKALLALAAAFSSAAFAVNTPAEFARLDTNYDLRISSGEYEVFTRAVFDEIDTDPDDDKLTVAEIMANEVKFVRFVFTAGHILGPAELTTAEKIQRLDANQDSVVSQTEYADGAAAKFRKWDINNNGELSATEWESGS